MDNLPSELTGKPQVFKMAYNMFLPRDISHVIKAEWEDFKEDLKDRETENYQLFWGGIMLRENEINEALYGSLINLDIEGAKTKKQELMHHKGMISTQLYF